MVTFILLRHGYSQYNKEQRFTGQLDIPLTRAGHAQAKAACKYLLQHYKVNAIYASDLSRACDTARPAADALNLPIIKRKDLREYSLGAWEGKKFEEARGVIPYNGESDVDVMKRALKAIAEIAAENDGKTVLVATHGGVVRLLLCAWMGYLVNDLAKIPSPKNASATVVTYDQGKVEFLLKDYNDYLPNKVSG